MLVLKHIIYIYLGVEGESCISILRAAKRQKRHSKATSKSNVSHGSCENYTL